MTRNKVKQKQFTIRKKIAGAGVNSIIVIPKLLQDDLPKGTIVELNIKVIGHSKDSSIN